MSSVLIACLQKMNSLNKYLKHITIKSKAASYSYSSPFFNCSESNEQNETKNRQDFVYQMNRLSKSYGKGTAVRPVLKDVSLSFYPGAKIGVLGSNGSGKSTLMKIMAGLDDEFQGESRLSDWANVSDFSSV